MANTHPGFVRAITLEEFCNEISSRTGIECTQVRSVIDNFVNFYMQELNPSEINDKPYKKGNFKLPEEDEKAIAEILSEGEMAEGYIE